MSFQESAGFTCLGIGLTVIVVGYCTRNMPGAQVEITSAVEQTSAKAVDAGPPSRGGDIHLVNDPREHAPSHTYASGAGARGADPGDLIFERGELEVFRICGDGGFVLAGQPTQNAAQGLQAALLAWSADAVMVKGVK